MPNLENALWCEYCNEREATREREVKTRHGDRVIAVCARCDALIREDGYAESGYQGEEEDK